MKELNEISLVVFEEGHGNRGKVVTPGMLEKCNIKLQISDGKMVLTGDVKIPLGVRGILDGNLIETFYVVEIKDNVLTTTQSEEFLIQSISEDYVELYNFEKDGGKVLFDWCLGMGRNNSVRMSAQQFLNGEFSYVEGAVQSKEKNRIVIEDNEYFVIWDCTNHCQETDIVIRTLAGTHYDMKSSFSYKMNPDNLELVAQNFIAIGFNANYRDPMSKRNFINSVIK